MKSVIYHVLLVLLLCSYMIGSLAAHEEKWEKATYYILCSILFYLTSTGMEDSKEKK